MKSTLLYGVRLDCGSLKDKGSALLNQVLLLEPFVWAFPQSSFWRSGMGGSFCCAPEELGLLDSGGCGASTSGFSERACGL